MVAKDWCYRFAVGFVLLLVCYVLVGAAMRFEKVAYALIVAVFGFLGFYLSEVAKNAIRARHVANQTWTYLLNAQYELTIAKNVEPYVAIAREWVSAREEFRRRERIGSGEAVNYAEADKAFRDKVDQTVADPRVLGKICQELEKLMSTPGKVDAEIDTSERSLKKLEEVKQQLNDREIALLGSEITLYALSLQSALFMAHTNNLKLFKYLKSAERVVEEEVKTELQRITFHVTKCYVELSMLQPLLDTARRMSLVRLSLSMLR